MVNTLFFLFNAFDLFAKVFGLCLVELDLLEVSSSLFDTLFMLFNHSTHGVLLLLVGLVFKDSFKLQQAFRGDFFKCFDLTIFDDVITQTDVCLFNTEKLRRYLPSVKAPLYK